MGHASINYPNREHGLQTVWFVHDLRPSRTEVVSIAISDSGWLAELKVNGELFSGKGGSAVLALQDLQTGIMKAAVKHQRRGRAPEKVRVAATLLQGEPN